MWCEQGILGHLSVTLCKHNISNCTFPWGEYRSLDNCYNCLPAQLCWHIWPCWHKEQKTDLSTENDISQIGDTKLFLQVWLKCFNKGNYRVWNSFELVIQFKAASFTDTQAFFLFTAKLTACMWIFHAYTICNLITLDRQRYLSDSWFDKVVQHRWLQQRPGFYDVMEFLCHLLIQDFCRPNSNTFNNLKRCLSTFVYMWGRLPTMNWNQEDLWSHHCQ